MFTFHPAQSGDVVHPSKGLLFDDLEWRQSTAGNLTYEAPSYGILANRFRPSVVWAKNNWKAW